MLKNALWGFCWRVTTAKHSKASLITTKKLYKTIDYIPEIPNVPDCSIHMWRNAQLDAQQNCCCCCFCLCIHFLKYKKKNIEKKKIFSSSILGRFSFFSSLKYTFFSLHLSLMCIDILLNWTNANAINVSLAWLDRRFFSFFFFCSFFCVCVIC